MSFTEPRAYARSKQSMLDLRYDANTRHRGDVRVALERMVPIAFPTAPAADMVLVLLGFTAFSTSRTENTTEAVATQVFHEVGLLQCPAGPRTGPAPNMNPNAPNNAYGRLANSPLVKRMMQAAVGGDGTRGATMSPDGWKTDLNSQLAVGIANILDDEQSFRRKRPLVAGDASVWSHWRLFTMLTAFSRGASQASKCIEPYETQLRATPESSRLRRFRALVVADIAARASGIGAKKGKMGASYAILRTDQKLESAVLLASRKGSSLALLNERYTDSPADAEVERVLSQTSAGTSVVVMAERAAEIAANIASIVGESGNGIGKPIALAALAIGGAAITASAVRS